MKEFIFYNPETARKITEEGRIQLKLLIKYIRNNEKELN